MNYLSVLLRHHSHPLTAALSLRRHLQPARLLLLALLTAAAPIAVAQNANAYSDDDDTAFLSARDAFRQSRLVALNSAREQISENYPLKAYADNYALRMLMEQNNEAQIIEFLQRERSSYVAEKLRADWIKWLAKNNRWQQVEQVYGNMKKPDAESQCLNEQAHLHRGERSVLDDIKSRWLTQLEPGSACQDSFDELVIAKQLTTDDVWQRARRQVEINRPARIQRTLNYLPEREEPSGKTFKQVMDSPMRYLISLPSNWSTVRTMRELASIAITRMAQKNPQQAAERWSQYVSNVPKELRQWVWGEIALQGARRHLDDTLTWYDLAGGPNSDAISDEARQWQVRAALRAHDWGRVRDGIENMSESLRKLPVWQYWLGRAYQAGGMVSEAENHFQAIAGKANFYGNLADEELGLTITIPATAEELSAEEKQAARDNVGLQRAITFFRLDLRTEGVREWNWSINGMDDRELLAAADLARRQGIWDRAINTADKTRSEHDYSLRFLAPYNEEIRPSAREQGLDDAWVYGLMRQESRFITRARSRVGASGLMQLMPATARWVAKKIGMSDYHPGRVNDRDVNVLLGTSYMRIILEDLDDHPLLASAAYNAGPGRAKRWRSNTSTLEGAIYAETIPFNETRDYVKKVLSNAVYYSILFNGQPDSLKRRLGYVAPKVNGNSTSNIP